MVLRYVAEEKSIAEISENDKRIRIIGIVVDVGNDYIVVDDGTGKIEVSVSEFHGKMGDMIKVIGRVLASNGKITIMCECYQLLKNFNLKLYKEAREIVKKVMKYV